MTIRIGRILEVAAAITQISAYLGLPVAVAAGALAGFVAYARQMSSAESILIALFVLTSILQSTMAAVLLIDRVFERRKQVENENAAIAYHVSPVAQIIVRDTENVDAEFQLRIKLYNGSGYPLRYHVILSRAVIEDRVTPDRSDVYVPGVLPSGAFTEVHFHSYKRGLLPQIGIVRGQVEMVYRYGHAAKGFAFESRRVYKLKALIRDDPKQKLIPVELAVVSEQNDLLSSAFDMRPQQAVKPS